MSSWRRCIRVVRPDTADLVTDTVLAWHPAGAGTALHLDVVAYFAEALGQWVDTESIPVVRFKRYK